MSRISSRFTGSSLVGALALSLVLSACGDGDAKTPETATAEKKVVTLGARDVAVAENQTLDAGIPISGTLEPLRTADVKAQISGTITGVRVDAGSAVGSGQSLGVITAEGIRSQATGAGASINAAQANLKVARQRAEALKALVETGAAARIDYDNARAAVEAAEAQVTIAQAGLTGAREQVSRAVAASPMGGIISAKFVNDGEAVSPGQRLFTVVNSSTLKLSGKIPVDQRGSISVGQEVSLTLTSNPARPIRGRIARIEPVADQASRQVGVHVEIANPTGEIVAGQFASGTILTSGSTIATVVPTAAVRKEGEAEYVYIVAQGSAVRKNVTTGTRDEAKGIVAITNGIVTGDVVITTPTVEIDPQTEVRLAGAPAATPAGAPAATAPTEKKPADSNTKVN